MDDKKKYGWGPRTDFELATVSVIQTVKNGAELATLAGLFSFIGKTYQSAPAYWASLALTLALTLFITVHVNSFFLGFAKPGSKRYVPAFMLSALLGLAASMSLQLWVMVPVIAAIERQVAATPPVPQLPAAPSPAETPALRAPGTDAPKPAAAPSAAAAAAPAPSVPPSAGLTRSSSPEARTPD